MVNDVKLFTRRLLLACSNNDFAIVNRMALEAIDECASASTFALVLRAGVDLTSDQLLKKAAQAFETCYMFELIRMGVSLNEFLPHTYARSGLALLARGADPSLVLLSLCSPYSSRSEVDLGAVTASLKAGADVNAVDRNGRSALHLVSMSDRNCSPSAVDMLINAGANVNATDGSGESVLRAALRLRFYGGLIGLSLIRAAANVNHASLAPSCLHLVAQMQDNKIDDLFAAAVRAGASVTAVDLHGNTPLHYLARVRKFSTRLANVLVDAGAKIDCVNARGETPLMCALAAPREGFAMFVSSLLSLGAPVDSRSVDNGYTVCHFAAELRDRELMSTLIDTYRCDVNATSNNGKTPLMIACANGAWDVVTLLLAAGAKPHATALLEAVTAARTDIAETLIAAGVDVCVGDQHGWTACHYAVAQANAELLNRLIAAGASVNVGGESLIHLAAIASLDGTMLQRLVAAGADANAVDESGQTACHVAAVNKSITLRVLIDAGARFDTVDKYGCTALTKAVASGSRECVSLLLAAGANATRVDRLGQTLLHVLLYGRRYDPLLVRALAAHGVDVNARDSSGLSAVDHVAKRADGVGCLCALFAIGAEVTVASESTRLALVRARGAEVCIGLQSMHLPALQLAEIIRFACASVSDDVPFHQLWSIATKVKHFRGHVHG